MNFKDLSFEQNIKKLEKIIDKLESNDLTLEDSLKNYKMGMEIYKHCCDMLNRMEGEIKIISKDGYNNAEEKDFNLEG